jgi:sigma-B regulation protein RsbU (phosphoserine phosphatase)
MRMLVAEDDPISRRLLEATLAKWGHEVVLATDGAQAWAALSADDAPRLAILDWMMPELDGVDVCRRVRTLPRAAPPYLILLTAKGRPEDTVAGLEAGADDYVTKPFDRDELRARIHAGMRIVQLQQSLADRVVELEQALLRVKHLQGLLPICAYCKKIRDDRNYWQQVEGYIAAHSDAQFSHSICPECYDHHVRPELDRLRRERGPGA